MEIINVRKMSHKHNNRAQKRGAPFFEDVPLVEFMYFVLTRTPCKSYCRVIQVFFVVLVQCLLGAN